MIQTTKILILLSVVLAFSTTYASAFFLNWGSPEPSPAPIQYYYQKRLLQGPSPAYTVGAEGDPQSVPLPAIPIQVPLQAQLAPAANIHNVQLVPCLCPVSQDLDYDKSQQENIYVNPNVKHNNNPQK